MPVIIENPKVNVAPSILEELKTFVAEEGQVIIHGLAYGGFTGTAIRIWPTTYLFDRDSPHRSELLHYEKISAFPIWTPIDPGKIFTFTLIFGGLPSSCTVFDLKEVIPENNGFHVPDIIRNRQDVYFLEF